MPEESEAIRHLQAAEPLLTVCPVTFVLGCGGSADQVDARLLVFAMVQPIVSILIDVAPPMLECRLASTV